MKEEKSFLYTLVLGVCILASLVLVGKMLLYRPAPVHTPHMSQTEQEKGESGAMYLSEGDLTELLAGELPEGFPVDGIRVTVSRTGTVTAAGTLHKDRVEGVDGMLRAALRWLPDTVDVTAVFTAACDGGRLVLTPTDARAAGISLPVGELPQEWTAAIDDAVNAALTRQCGPFTSARLLDGGLQLQKDA